MEKIYAYKINESELEIYCSEIGVIEELYYYFRYRKPNFMPNRYSKWDGIIRLFNKKTGRLPLGLYSMLVQWCRINEYELIDDEPRVSKTVGDKTVNKFIGSLNLPENIVPYDYQIKALKLAIELDRYVCHAATSAGKSLIIYMISRYYQLLGSKILIIVPSTNLVNQMYDDFYAYSKSSDWNAFEHCHRIYAGLEKSFDKSITISTWQSLQKCDQESLDVFDTVLVDECHKANADVLTKLLKACSSAYARIGFTGSLNQNTSNGYHPVSVQASFGPIHNIVSSKELRDSGKATKTAVKMIELLYGNEDRFEVSQMSYQDEIQWLIHNEKRNNMIHKVVEKLSGNTLILCNFKDHVDNLYDIISKTKKVYVITGDVKTEDRDEIKRRVESETGVVVIATAGTMSTGVSIKNLHNLVLSAPTKSFVTVVQSVGRVMRLHDSKDVSLIIDFSDNLKRMVDNKNRINYSYKHSIERLTYYADEKHDVKLCKIKMEKRNGKD